MNREQSKLVLITTVVGAAVGLGLGIVLAETKKEQLMLAERYGEENAIVQPGFRDWFAVAIAAITLIRQLGNILTPKV